MKDGLHRSAKQTRELLEPEEESQYADFFSIYHTNEQPMIARNGTNITWPAGWSEVRRARLAGTPRHGAARSQGKGRSKGKIVPSPVAVPGRVRTGLPPG